MATIQVKQTGIKDLNLQRFRSVLDSGGSLAKGCRFIVSISPPSGIKRSFPQDLHYLCETAEFPGRGFGLAQARTYGPIQMFPNNTEYQPLSLTFLCRSSSVERRFFDDWLDFINPVNTFNFAYPNDYYSQINIYQYAEFGTTASTAPPFVPQILYHWRIHKAWPNLVNPQPTNWAEQDVLRLQVSFAYKYWDRPNLNSGLPGNSSDGSSTASLADQTASNDIPLGVSINQNA